MAQSDDDPQGTLLAACIQFDVVRGQVATNAAAAVAGIHAAAAQGARLCVLPEMWSTSFLPDYPDAMLQAAAAAETALCELSQRHAMVVVGSSAEAHDGAVRNCARVYDGGREVGRYRKVHLFSPHAEHRYHEAGNEPLVCDTRIGRLGVMICYDLRFPELARHYFRTGAEVVAVPAQWPEARAQHWRTLLRARAIENQCFYVGCNRTGQEPSLKNDEDLLAFPGDGRIVDPTGEILIAGSGTAGPLVAELELRTARTMRRILPIERDQRPSVYRRLFEASWPAMQKASREDDDRE